ncbi:hypothetical protein FRB97_001663 [Tulasnella sp. 331]|nr:hypothetical protein FRB97_001663 [Tulasnella sp. 331]
MDVKYATSGAINHEHYTLVQKVESAKDPGLADEAIIQEIDAMRNRFHKPTFASSSPYCRDMLLILLYCETAMTFEPPQRNYLEFALPAAVGLAEGGKTVSDRRVGYQYCAKIMPPDHELQLMLINTYRKDLESHEEPRICLALNALIQSSTADVIPAVDTRLEDLLSHKSVQVKQRVMTTFRRLAKHDPEIVRRTTRKITKRLQDNPVTEAAMLLALDLVKAGVVASGEITTILVSLVEIPARSRAHQTPKAKIVAVLGELIDSIPPSDRQPVAELIMRTCATSPSDEVKLACFRALARFPIEAMEHFVASSDSPPHPVSSIKLLLFANEPNKQYTALACLLALPVQIWVGTSATIPAQLEETDVHRIMSFLTSTDSTIRVMTIRLLNRVDPGILMAYLDQFIASIPSPSEHTLAKCEHYASRAVELSRQLDADDGAAFSSRVVTTLVAVQYPREVLEEDKVKRDTAYLDAAKRAGLGAGVKAVLEEAAEIVLGHLREESQDFRASFTEALCQSIFTDAGSVTPTAVLLCAAVACEYGYLLKGLQPQDTLRCKQFLDLAKDLDATKKVISDAKSTTLPDTLIAVDLYTSRQAELRKLSQAQALTRVTSSASIASSLRSSRPAQRLKYDAYEAPSPRVVSPKNTAGRVRRSSRTPSASTRADNSVQRAESHVDKDPMAQTLSPGRLALAVEDGDLKRLARSQQKSPTGGLLSPEAAAARIDLISLESPFHVEPSSSSLQPPSPVSHAEADESFHARFRTSWELLRTTSRGWGESSPKDIAKHLQELGMMIEATELDVFSSDGGEPSDELLGIALGADNSVGAAVRLRPGEDDSCLWILKCDSIDLRLRIRQVLQRER